MWSVSQLASSILPQIAQRNPYFAATRRAWKGVILLRCVVVAGAGAARVANRGRALGVRVELAACSGGADGLRASLGWLSARATTFEASTFHAQLRSVPCPKRDTSMHARNITLSGKQSWNQGIRLK